jgi:thiol-disulfide isomerase/thioredoxin
MSDTSVPVPPTPNRSRWLIIGGLAAVAVAIAIWFLLSNGGAQARECPVQAEAAAAIGDAATGELAGLNGTGEGRGYPKQAFKDASGTAMTLADFKGKAMLVNFWATWCIPCREEMPALDALAARYNSDAFMVLPINLDPGDDGVAKGAAFLKDAKLTNLPLYADGTLEAFKGLQQQAVAVGLPTTLILDANGCELAVLPGPAEWNTPDGYKVIEALLGLSKS